VPCSLAPLGATRDAYAAFLAGRPGVNAGTIKISVTCQDAAGRRRLFAAGDSTLNVDMEYTGAPTAAAEAVANTQNCCPVVDGCAPDSLCASPAVASAGVTGGAAGPGTTATSERSVASQGRGGRATASSLQARGGARRQPHHNGLTSPLSRLPPSRPRPVRAPSLH
jgi:hypothetical protein